MNEASPSNVPDETNECDDEHESAPPSMDIAFARCVERLEELIETETRILTSRARIDFEALNLRKTHALLEFTRVARNTPPQSSPEARERLSRLAHQLAGNAEILEQHLQAMQEITNLIVDSIRNDDSDGTYSRKGVARR